jgi:acetyl esterase/lipase
MGFAVVNINFRLGPAPAAVEDSRCALRWIARNATKYNFDVRRIVVTGDSSGSHLALTTGLMTPGAGFDERCAGGDDVRAAAVVSWFAVTDVADVIEGVNQKSYAARWFADVADAPNVARRISPIQYVRADAPAVFTVHGDADSVAPYAHATRLHKALDEAKAPNQLMTIPGGGHGSFKRDEFIRIYAAIREFLHRHGIVGRP